MPNGHNATDFRYPLSQVAITYFLMPVVSLISLGLGAFLFEEASIFFGVLLILFGAWFIFLSVFGSLMCSSITVSGEGIAAHNFGRTLKFIRWQDVTQVKKVRRWNAGSRSFEDVFHVFDGTFSPLRERLVNLRGPVVFTGKIRGLRGLRDRINEASHRYHFSLVALDQEAARKLATQAGAGAWKRAVPKVEEVPLTEL